MGTFTQAVNGKEALDAQERSLNFLEQATFAKVVSYAKSTKGAVSNDAVLQELALGAKNPPLHLEAMAPTADPTAIVSKQLAQGKTVVFHEICFVSGAGQLVLGFR